VNENRMVKAGCLSFVFRFSISRLCISFRIPCCFFVFLCRLIGSREEEFNIFVGKFFVNCREGFEFVVHFLDILWIEINFE